MTLPQRRAENRMKSGENEIRLRDLFITRHLSLAAILGAGEGI